MTGSWVERGTCQTLRHTVGGVREAIGVFYPKPGSLTLKFRLVCDVCPVECDCLLWGILAEDYGGWGGTSEQERKAMRSDIAEGFTSLADILRARGCVEVAERVETEDDAAATEAATILASAAQEQAFPV